MRSALTSIDVPEVGLVVLCGASGSGKSTFARRHFSDTEVVSSDRCRALVGDDETDQSVTEAAFELLHSIVDKRLEGGRLTVVDATNVKPEDRASLVELARRWDVLATAIVFDLPLSLCVERSGSRQDRRTPEHAVKRQHATLRRTAKRLRKERFTRVYTLGSSAELRLGRGGPHSALEQPPPRHRPVRHHRRCPRLPCRAASAARPSRLRHLRRADRPSRRPAGDLFGRPRRPGPRSGGGARCRHVDGRRRQRCVHSREPREQAEPRARGAQRHRDAWACRVARTARTARPRVQEASRRVHRRPRQPLRARWRSARRCPRGPA